MNRRSLALQVRTSLDTGAALHRDLINSCIEPLLDAAFAITHAIENGGKILLFGNGGSAADAQHIAAEFVGRFLNDRRPLPAIALTTDTSALTAIGNDYGFDQVFYRQVVALASRGDVVIGISTSGRSPNVLAGLQAAKELGAMTVSITGGSATSPACALSDIAIAVPSSDTPRIQECHLVLEHVMCECVETLLAYSPLSGAEPETRDEPLVNGAVFYDKIIEIDCLLKERQIWAHKGKTVVWTNGCFDLLHAGHIESLFQASRLGDVLVVGVNDDAAVRQFKGSTRPIVPASDRALVLAALAFVDRVIIYSDETPELILGQLKPEVHCKGYDYAPPDGKAIPEASVVASYGGRIEFIPLLEGRSTTSLIDRILSPAGADPSVTR